MVFSIHNNLSVPIMIQSITSALDTSGYPAPPAGCGGTYLTLPTFSGAFTVPGGGGGASPGVPIELKNSGTDQSACTSLTYHFTYSGSARYTDGTSTTLASSPNPSVSGQAITFTAVVAGNNPGTDASVPSGSVNFYKCSTSAPCAAGSSNLLGTGTITSGGKATFTTSTLGIGTADVEAVYPASGTNFTGSTSNVLAQTVTSSTVGTSTALTSSPDPSGQGQSVTLSATTTRTSGLGTPTGTVTFHQNSSTGAVIGTATLKPNGQAVVATSSLPAGTDNLYAVYSGDSHFSSSTSPVRTQGVIGLPIKCTGTFPNFFYGSQFLPFIDGTNGNDFVDAPGGNFFINAFNGNDCLSVGDGNNWITDGNGNDVVVAGNGSNAIWAGNGNDTVTVGNGSNVIVLGNGTDTVYLGAGSSNAVYGGRGHDTCHLPKPPASWHGAAAAYYHDTIANCTVVSP